MHFTIINNDTLRVEFEHGQSIKAESDAVATMSHNVTVQVRLHRRDPMLSLFPARRPLRQALPPVAA